MRSLFFLLVLLAGCNACGAEDPEIDPLFKPMLGHYLRFAPSSGEFDRVTSITFGDVHNEPGENLNGHCLHQPPREIAGNAIERKTRYIRIAEHMRTSPLLALTVYHELGHCLHDLEHTYGEFDIMNAKRSKDVESWTQETVDAALASMFLPAPSVEE